MLLSRVAESVYWAGRYLERAEATARLVKVHTELFLDLPKSSGLGWSSLLAVTGSGETFDDRYDRPTEDMVVEFLAIDVDNAGSIRASLTGARTNFRLSRATFPESAWRVVNELYHLADDAGPEAVNRGGRLAWMDTVTQRCQLLAGILTGVMSHDEAYSFLEIGRFVERADMTTRVLDVQAGVLTRRPDIEERAADAYADITWMSVLDSLCARQMFRRTFEGAVSGPDALHFLLRDPQFPRSIEHCLTAIARCLLELPRCQAPMAGCAELQETLESVSAADLGSGDLHEYIEELQRGIAGLHHRVSDTYFGLAPSSSSILLPA